MSATFASARNGRSMTESVATKKLLWVAPLAGVLAAVANSLVWLIAINMLQIPMLMPLDPTTPMQLPLGAVVAFSLVPAIGAGVLLALLGRFVKRPLFVFSVVAGLFLLVSFLPDILLPAATATKLTLMTMHIIAAAVITSTLIKLGRAA